jgi:hypothetical protein
LDVRWLTYAELGEVLHIGRESARQLAKRRRWARQQGNDGQARVGVPVEDLEARIEARAEALSEPQDEPPAEAQDEPRNDPGITVLTNHIVRLERELEAVKVERDTERAVAARAVLAEERLSDLKQVLEEMRQQRDKWQEQAERLALAPPAPINIPAGNVAESRGWGPWRRRA